MRFICLCVLAIFSLGLSSSFTLAADPLEDGFTSPPEQTRPRVYWYWLDGQISKEGITADLEAMKRVGIGGAYIGLIDGQSDHAANPDLPPLSDAWWSNIEHAVREGGRLGIDIGLFNCPGWSMSGGPWIEPEQSMRYLASTEVRVTGPMQLEQALPAAGEDFQDVALLAFPAPIGDAPLTGRVEQTADTYTLTLEGSATVRSVSVTPSRPIIADVTVEASSDGKTFHPIHTFRLDRHNTNVNVGPVPLAATVITLPETTAKSFRLRLNGADALTTVAFRQGARVDRVAEKQLQKTFEDPNPTPDAYHWPTLSEPEIGDLVVDAANVIDLTNKLADDGTLTWDVPEGDWIIQRLGMLTTGVTNAPAPAEATGLEVDKLNKNAVRHHFESYVGELLRRMPEDDRKGLTTVVADSYEMGPQNWTDGMTDAFEARYGYDSTPWLPVLSGRVVGGVDQSDRFLWDLRRLVADRVASDYVGGLRELCHENGLELWLENYGHWGYPAEFLQYGGASDHVGGEFWVTGLGGIEVRAAASAAHTYGKNIVWAEAFTGGIPFAGTPRDLKARGDWALAEGINQFVLHVYVHQPDEQKPGMSAWFGTEFNRHNTWFEQSKAWIDYNRRCSFLLQQGQPVADVAYFIGEDAPIMTGSREPALPAGYDYDFINAEVLLTRASVEKNRLVLESGMSYGLLVLPPLDTMRPELLETLVGFAKAGLPVIGPLPTRSPSLQNYPQADERVKTLAGELGKHLVQGNDIAAAMKVGPDVADLPPGVLFDHRDAGDTQIYFLSNQSNAARELRPTFRVPAGLAVELWDADTGRMRRVASTDGPAGATVPLRLDPTGSTFVIFRPHSTREIATAAAPSKQTLVINQAIYRSIDSDHSADVTERVQSMVTGNRLDLAVTNEALGGDPADQHYKRLDLTYTLDDETRTASIPENNSISLPHGSPVAGPWTLDIAGQTLTLDRTQPWTDLDDLTVRYFSGTATYSTTFTASNLADTVTLDLGDVGALAEVTLNNQSLGTLWTPPYQIDATGVLKDGENTLKIAVTNAWYNRLLGQRHAPGQLTGPDAVASWYPRLTGNEPPEPSGLLGTVSVHGASIFSDIAPSPK